MAAGNVDAKLLKQTKFPLEFNQKVDMKKVNLEVMRRWISGKISELLGSDDDVVVELCSGLLESDRYVSWPRKGVDVKAVYSWTDCDGG